MMPPDAFWPLVGLCVVVSLLAGLVALVFWMNQR